MKTIKLNDIKTENKYLRLNSDIENLAESIKTIGLIHPLSVSKDNQLLAGGRRFSAIKSLGWDEVAVIVVDKSELEQELISIDENIVRTPLDKLELENAFNRGREIYETLNPEVDKIEIKIKEMTPEQKKEAKLLEDQDETSFAAITSQKTGLSKSVIKSAIRRDELSSNKIKKARSEGDLSASQVNEIIRLSKKDQERLLPLIQDKTVKDLRKIITQAQKEGLDSALQYADEMTTAPREITELIKSTKKINKALSKLIVEDIEYEGKEMNLLEKELHLLKSLLGDYFPDFKSNSNTDSVAEQSQNWQ